MDKQLLNALDNLSVSLSMLSESLNKKDAKSGVGSAMQSGNFGKQIEEINNSIKDIKTDTSKILDNTETIIKLQKEKKDSGMSLLSGVGKEGNKKMLKDGISVIGLIAGAVLALGLSFKLIGTVDWKSVLGITVALPIIVAAFERAAANKDLTPSKIALVGMSLVGMSIAITASSWVLSKVTTISLLQGITVVLIAVAFGAAAVGLGHLMKGFKDISIGDAFKASLILPIVLYAVSIAIWKSSQVLSLVQPIGLPQAFTAVMIAAAFGVMSYGLGRLVSGFKGIDPATAVAASIMMPIVLIALSYAIVQASWWFSTIKPIGLFQAFTAVMIAAAFGVMSYGLGRLVSGFKGIDPATAVAASVMMPIVLIALSYAIVQASWWFSTIKPIGLFQALTAILISATFVVLAYAVKPLLEGVKGVGPKELVLGGLVIIGLTYAIVEASKYLADFKPIPFGNLLNFVFSSLAFSVAIVIMAVAVRVVNGLGTIDKYIEGGLSIVVVASTIALSSQILGLGDYSKYPSIDWSIGVGLSLLSFGISMLALGLAVTSGIGFVGLIAGIPAVLGVAATMVAVDAVLANGSYSKYPPLDWALGVGGSLLAFSSAIVVLGVINSVGGLASTLSLGVVKNPIEAGSAAIKTVAQSIVDVSFILKKGSYSGGPTKEWSEGIALALGGFAPIYGILMANKVMSIFGGGIGPDDFAKAIRTISQGIVDAANFFSDNSASFDVTKAPSEDWAKGVGSSISAFAPVFDFISKNSAWYKGADVDGLNDAIITIASAITSTSFIFATGDYSKYPQKEWIDGTIYALQKFSEIIKLASFDNLNGGGIISGVSNLFGKSPLEKVVSNVTLLSIAFEKLGSSMNSLSNAIDTLDLDKLEMVKGLTSNVILLSLMDPNMFNDMMDKLEKRGGVFNDLIKDFEEKKTGSVTAKSVNSTVASVKGKSDSQVLADKVDRMTAILFDISTVVGSGGTLKTYLNSIKDKQLHGSSNAPSVHRSDKRLKNFIRKVGQSSSGLNIYVFTYTFNHKVIYQGVMAQELLNTPFEDALIIDKNGFYSVDYSKIDVEFKKITTSGDF